MWWLLSTLLLTSGSEQAAPNHLRVYRDFVEISRPLREQERFKELDWKSVDPEFIHILNCGKDYSIRTRLVERDADGHNVYVRHGGNQTVKAKLIDSVSGLVQTDNDSAFAGRYIYVDRKNIEYIERPSGGYTLLTIETSDGRSCDENASISYIQNNMKWVRNHELLVDHDSSVLMTWATLQNHGQDTKHGDVVELIVGGEGYSMPYRYAVRSYEAPVALAATVGRPSETDLHGVKIYALPSGISLGPKESIRTPLITQDVEAKRIASAVNFLTLNSEGSGKFQRIYQIRVKKFIPDGRVVVREQGRIVGDTGISEPVAADQKVRIKLGIDVDLTYRRNITSAQVGNDTVFNVHMVVTNKRAEEVNLECSEEIRTGRIASVASETLNGSLDLKLTFTAQKILMTGMIGGNSSGELTFVAVAKKGTDTMIWR